MIRGNTCTIDPPSDPRALIDFDPFEADAATAPTAALTGPTPEQGPAPELEPASGQGCPDTSIGACPDHNSSPTKPASTPRIAPQVPDLVAASEPPCAPAPAEPSTSSAPQPRNTAPPQDRTTAPPQPPADLPENIQNQLFDAYLNSDQPATQIAEHAGITLIQFIRWQSHPQTHAIIADLERIATERAATQCTLAQPGAIHSLTLISAQTFDRPETARKAASLLTRLHAVNEKRKTPPPSTTPAPKARTNRRPRNPAAPQSHNSAIPQPRKAAHRPPTKRTFPESRYRSKAKKADSLSKNLPQSGEVI